MPRRPRVFVEGGIYHVYNRFARGAELFADPEEAIEFLEILRKARDRDVRGHNAVRGTLALASVSKIPKISLTSRHAVTAPGSQTVSMNRGTPGTAKNRRPGDRVGRQA